MKPKPNPLAVSERDFQEQIIDLAHLLGWRVAHFRPARTAKGWRTPVEADAKGFPDLVLLRPPRLIFAELKRDGGKASSSQRDWLFELAECNADEDRFEVCLWRPSDWAEIKRALGEEVLDG